MVMPEAPSLLPPTLPRGVPAQRLFTPFAAPKPVQRPLPGSSPDWLSALGPDSSLQSYSPAYWTHSPGVSSELPWARGAELGLWPRDPGPSKEPTLCLL